MHAEIKGGNGVCGITTSLLDKPCSHGHTLVLDDKQHKHELGKQLSTCILKVGGNKTIKPYGNKKYFKC